LELICQFEPNEYCTKTKNQAMSHQDDKENNAALREQNHEREREREREREKYG